MKATQPAALPVIGLTSRTMPFRAARKDRPTETVTRSYIDAVERAGGLCLMLPNTDPARAEAYLDRIDGLLLTGGDDPDPILFGEDPHPRIDLVDPRRDHFEIALVQGARARNLPLFGICRGVQILNIALGGDIYQDVPSQTGTGLQHTQRRLDDGPWHAVDIRAESHLAKIVGARQIRVNSFHHQACRRPGSGLSVCATAGDGIAEALEDSGQAFCLGVQWHPELGGDGGAELFDAFVQSARIFTQNERKSSPAASNPGETPRTGR